MSSIRVAPVLLLASFLSACGGGVGSNGVPVTPAQALQPAMNPGTSQSVTRASQVTIQEFPIPAAWGGPLGGIAVGPDSSVWVSLCGQTCFLNSPIDIGACYNGSFQQMISWSPFAPPGQGPPIGPVAVTPDGIAHFATQLSDPDVAPLGYSGPDETPAITTYGPGCNGPNAFQPLPLIGTVIADMASDSKGNLWIAENPVGGVASTIFVNGQTQVQWATLTIFTWW